MDCLHTAVVFSVSQKLGTHNQGAAHTCMYVCVYVYIVYVHVYINIHPYVYLWILLQCPLVVEAENRELCPSMGSEKGAPFDTSLF